MLICWAVMIALLLQPPLQADSSTVVSVENNEVWLQTASGNRQITHDGVPKRLAALAPSGDGVAYVVDKDVPNNAPEEEVILVNLKGEVLKRIVPEGYVFSAFGRLEWIDNERIGAMSCGHANCMYWVLNPGSGKTIQVMSGGFDFIWSHNRRFVVRHLVSYYGTAPEGERLPEHDAVMFNQDGVFVYPPGIGTREFDDRSHDMGRARWPQFVWSPNDEWVAFTDMIGPEDDSYVVLVSPKGEVLRETVPIDIGFDATLDWQDDAHLQLHMGGRTFKFVINGKQLTEVRTSH